MIPKFRVWNKSVETMHQVVSIWSKGTMHVVIPFENSVATIFYDFELMQSTGLKDKNGIDIYEGDILVGKQYLTTNLSTPFEINGVVKYSNRNTFFYLDNGSFDHDRYISSLGSSIYQYEIIGNIYENPELLEASK